MSDNHYRLVCFHDTEKKSEVMFIGAGTYPKGWSSISRGYPTVEELREKEGIPDEPCSVCGSLYTTSYSEDVKEKMIARKMCFHCNFWEDIIGRQDDKCARIAGVHYVIGEKTNDASRFRGFSGRKFNIRFFDDRGEVETTNLWHQGDIPKAFRDRLFDNAEFVKA